MSDIPTIKKNTSWLRPFEKEKQNNAEQAVFIPKIDVKENTDTVIATAELPGIHENDIEVSVSDETITISGEKKSEKEEQNGKFYRIERRYGSFQRNLSLPCEIQPEKSEAIFKNGVLTVSMPKSPTAKKSEKKLTVKIIP